MEKKSKMKTMHTHEHNYLSSENKHVYISVKVIEKV